MRIEVMTPADWPEVAEVYAEGLATGDATFEAELPSWEQWDASHLAGCRFVARDADRLLGWAALSPVSRRPCYRGVAEVSVYVREAERGRGVGRSLLEHVVGASEAAGIWMLQGSTFPENAASLRLQAACGFRVVGRRERIAQRRGRWRDTVLTERRSRRVGVEVSVGTMPERQELLADLRAMPEFLAGQFGALSAEEARRGGPGGTFSPVEQCWHLADLESEGFGARIRLLLREERPFLPDFDGARLAREREYRARSLVDGLQAFRAARESNVALLRGVPDEAWSRGGVQEGVGEVRLSDVPRLMHEHDASHKAEIVAWFQARQAAPPTGG